jgi:hypothetical protein
LNELRLFWLNWLKTEKTFQQATAISKKSNGIE